MEHNSLSASKRSITHLFRVWGLGFRVQGLGFSLDGKQLLVGLEKAIHPSVLGFGSTVLIDGMLMGVQG